MAVMVLQAGSFFSAASTSKTSCTAPSRRKRRLGIASMALGVVLSVVVPAIYFATQVAPAPERADWSVSSSAFDNVVADMPAQPAAGESVYFNAPHTIGAYAITEAVRTESGAIFYDSEGCGVMDLAGFAYLPGGVANAATNGLDSPRYLSLGGGWYSFCAGW